jgi:hypothetical protein
VRSTKTTHGNLDAKVKRGRNRLIHRKVNSLKNKLPLRTSPKSTLDTDGVNKVIYFGYEGCARVLGESINEFEISI